MSLAERFRAKLFQLRTSHKSRLTLSLLIIAVTLFLIFTGILLIRVIVNLFDPRYATEFPRDEFSSERFPAIAICPGWMMISDGGDDFHIQEGKIYSANCSFITVYSDAQGQRQFQRTQLTTRRAEYKIEHRDHDCLESNFDVASAPVIHGYQNMSDFLVCSVNSDGFLRVQPYHQDRPYPSTRPSEPWEFWHSVPKNDATRLAVSKIEFRSSAGRTFGPFYQITRQEDEAHLPIPADSQKTVFSMRFTFMNNVRYQQYYHGTDLFYLIAALGGFAMLLQVGYWIIKESILFLTGWENTEQNYQNFSADTSVNTSGSSKSGAYGTI